LQKLIYQNSYFQNHLHQPAKSFLKIGDLSLLGILKTSNHRFGIFHFLSSDIKLIYEFLLYLAVIGFNIVIILSMM